MGRGMERAKICPPPSSFIRSNISFSPPWFLTPTHNGFLPSRAPLAEKCKNKNCFPSLFVFAFRVWLFSPLSLLPWEIIIITEKEEEKKWEAAVSRVGRLIIQGRRSLARLKGKTGKKEENKDSHDQGGGGRRIKQQFCFACLRTYNMNAKSGCREVVLFPTFALGKITSKNLKFALFHRVSAKLPPFIWGKKLGEKVQKKKKEKGGSFSFCANKYLVCLSVRTHKGRISSLSIKETSFPIPKYQNPKSESNVSIRFSFVRFFQILKKWIGEGNPGVCAADNLFEPHVRTPEPTTVGYCCAGGRN